MRFLCGINAGKTYRGNRQSAQKERTRYCGLGRDGENVSGERERERAAWVFNRGQHLVDFDQWHKST